DLQSPQRRVCQLGQTGAHGQRPHPHLTPLRMNRRTFVRALLASALLQNGCRKKPNPRPEDIDPEANFHGRTLVVPATGVYMGAYIDFGDHEDDVTLEGIEGFERLAGKRQAIIASSSYWGLQTFPDANVRLVARHGAIPLVFWSPWDAPYEEGFPPDK